MTSEQEQVATAEPIEQTLQRLLDAQVQAREAASELVKLEAEVLKAQEQTKLFEQRRMDAQEAVNAAVTRLEPRVNALSLMFKYQTTEIKELTKMFEAQLLQTNHALGLLLELTRLRVHGVHSDADRVKLSQLLDQADRTSTTLVDSEVIKIQKELFWLRRSLGALEIQRAQHGALDAPVSLLNEITATEEQIVALETRYKQLQTIQQQQVAQ